MSKARLNRRIMAARRYEDRYICPPWGVMGARPLMSLTRLYEQLMRKLDREYPRSSPERWYIKFRKSRRTH